MKKVKFNISGLALTLFDGIKEYDAIVVPDEYWKNDHPCHVVIYDRLLKSFQISKSLAGLLDYNKIVDLLQTEEELNNYQFVIDSIKLIDKSFTMSGYLAMRSILEFSFNDRLEKQILHTMKLSISHLAKQMGVKTSWLKQKLIFLNILDQRGIATPESILNNVVEVRSVVSKNGYNCNILFYDLDKIQPLIAQEIIYEFKM